MQASDRPRNPPPILVELAIGVAQDLKELKAASQPLTYQGRVMQTREKVDALRLVWPGFLRPLAKDSRHNVDQNREYGLTFS